MKHVYSDQCMSVDQSKENGKLVLGKKYFYAKS